jgi:hypothetical protein
MSLWDLRWVKELDDVKESEKLLERFLDGETEAV